MMSLPSPRHILSCPSCCLSPCPLFLCSCFPCLVPFFPPFFLRLLQRFTKIRQCFFLASLTHHIPHFSFFLHLLQRIMEIRAQIAREWVEELREVSEENALLMRETVLTSFGMADMQLVMPAQVSRAAHGCRGGW